MPVDKNAYLLIKKELNEQATLVAVSKNKPVEAIQELYNLGHRDFGENYVQELLEKQKQLPGDISWHFIGHLQSNKVKFIASFIHLIQSVDSLKLLKEINKQGEKNQRIISVLLQVHIAQEETKFGFDKEELKQTLQADIDHLQNIHISGLMGMASFTKNEQQVKEEFQELKKIFDQFSTIKASNLHLQTLSMGMSSDYKIAIGEGSNMVRIGSLLFGQRD